MVDSMNYAALDLVWDTLDATIVLGQDMPSLPCAVRDLRESQIESDRRKAPPCASDFTEISINHLELHRPARRNGLLRGHGGAEAVQRVCR